MVWEKSGLEKFSTPNCGVIFPSLLCIVAQFSDIMFKLCTLCYRANRRWHYEHCFLDCVQGGGDSTSAGTAPRAPGGAHHGWQQGRDQPTVHGTVHIVRRCETLVRRGRWVGQEGVRDRGTRECQQTGGGATQPPRTREPHQEGQGRAHQTRRRGTASRRGNQNSGNREPEWSGWWSVRMGGSGNKGDGLASQPCGYRVPGQPLLNWHQVGGVSRSPDGLFAQQEREPIRGRPAVRGKRTYGGRPGQHVEE